MNDHALHQSAVVDEALGPPPSPRPRSRSVSPRRRRRVLWASLITSLIGVAALETTAGNYRLAYDGQASRCLEGWLFLIDLGDGEVAPGGFLSFAPPQEVSDHYGQPVAFLKRVQGFPGDEVVVTQVDTRVNGHVVGTGLALLETIGKTAHDVERRFIVPEGHLFLMGDTHDSFDGRYWGTVPYDRLIGKAYWIL